MTKQVDEGLSGRNNVEIESKLPCEKSVEEQLEVMEEYTRVIKLPMVCLKESEKFNV